MNMENTLLLVGGGEGKLRSSGVIAVKAGGVVLGAGSCVDQAMGSSLGSSVQLYFTGPDMPSLTTCGSTAQY